MSEQDKASRANDSDVDDIQEEKPKPVSYIPKNPMIRPADVKISEIMQTLMGKDKQ